MRADALGETQQHALALLRRQARPVAAFETPPGRSRRRHPRRRVAGSDLRDHPSVDGADAVEGLARGGWPECAVDEYARARLQRSGAGVPVNGGLVGGGHGRESGG